MIVLRQVRVRVDLDSEEFRLKKICKLLGVKKEDIKDK